MSKKLYIQTSTHQAFHEELELVKGQTESFYKSKMSMMEQNHTLKVQELKWQLEKMEHEIERLQNIEVQMKEKLLLQEGTINKLKEDTPIETDTAIEDEVIIIHFPSIPTIHNNTRPFSLVVCVCVPRLY